MTLPFTREQFFEVFARYNEGVWPMQFVLYGLALAALVLAWSRIRQAGWLVSLMLALLWGWMGVVYHLVHFKPINPAAALFGAAFILGAAAFLWDGVACDRLRFTRHTFLGYALIGYALGAYPVLAMLFGHAYPAMPTFGLPCPTTIFTLGMLALLEPPYTRRVLAVPLLWTLVGAQAALLFGVYEDFGLLVAGMAGLWLASRGRRTYEQPLVS